MLGSMLGIVSAAVTLNLASPTPHAVPATSEQLPLDSIYRKRRGGAIIMHTFYEPLQDNYRDSTADFIQLGAWAETWKQAGFQTRVLTEHDAEKHPLFKAVEKRIAQFGLNSYNRMCYRR